MGAFCGAVRTCVAKGLRIVGSGRGQSDGEVKGHPKDHAAFYTRYQLAFYLCGIAAIDHISE